MPRTVKEWIGATPDTPVPPRVRLRVFERAQGRCQLCTRKITAGVKWICDHIKALINGGENRESNLQCICDWCDKKEKTPADVAEKSKVARVKAKHLGIRKRGSFATNRDGKWKKKVDGTVERRP
jgi:5-methylcytosine-specific restriction enzyme A